MMADVTRTCLFLTIIMILSAMALPQTANSESTDGNEWNIETVDSVGDVGQYTSLALDIHGYPRISYYDLVNTNLKYAWWNGSAWNIETVDNQVNVGASTSLALDNNDRPHISYRDNDNTDLKYAKWNGTNWNIETVDSAGRVGEGSSIALDSHDYPCISYYDYHNRLLKLARWNGSAWKIQVVDSSVVGSTTIGLDSNDYPHIGYGDGTTQDLKYARWNGSAWKIETVDSGDVYGFASLVVDSNDYPRISYGDKTSIALKYARWNGSAWGIEIVDSLGFPPSFTSLAIDGSDNPHISYFDYTNSGLKYARWNGTGWNVETVDSDGYVGTHTSIALNSNGYPHISYHDSTNGTLKYATKARLNIVPVLPPTNLTLCVFNGDDVLLNWSAPSSPLLDHYLVYRSADQRAFDFSNPVHNTSSDPNPLKTDWLDVGAANSTSPREYYYLVRAVDSLGSKSATSNTAGKWNRSFREGRDAFSLPLEPFVNRNVSWYSENIPGTELVRWMNATGHWVTHYPSMGEGVNDIPVTMGDSYEISLSSSINFTFCGYPASMIRFQEGLGDSLVFRRSLSAKVDGNDINLSWEAVARADSYLVFRSEERNGLHNLSLLPIANATETYWIDSGVIGNGRSEYYYMVIPADPSGGLGSNTYSIGVFTEEYQSGTDTFALPLKPVEPHSLDWYCDDIPNVVGIVHMMKGMWRLHAKEMPEGIYDEDVLQGEGYQISIEGPSSKFTFVGY